MNEENNIVKLDTFRNIKAPSPEKTNHQMLVTAWRFASSIAPSEADKKQAKHFHNCITEPIFNIPISQVCPPGLHITLGIFTKLYGLLEDECHNLDLELALHSSEDAHSSFSTYSQELQRWSKPNSHMMNCSKCKCTATVKKGFSVKEGPFVKKLDSALQSIGVHRQQYFGGAFVGNHVHKALKLANIQTLSKSLAQTALNKLPNRSTEAKRRSEMLVNAFSMFAQCHNIYDLNFIDEAQTHALALDRLHN
ncbi:hypothetical protein EMCRGX_G027683 [Ephydatia muelleri]